MSAGSFAEEEVWSGSALTACMASAHSSPECESFTGKQEWKCDRGWFHL